MATLTNPVLAAGYHEIIAYYGGDSKFMGSADAIKQAIGPVPRALDNTETSVDNLVQSENTAPILKSEFSVKAYPNPFTDHIYFDLQLPTDSRVRLEIYNINGVKLATLYNESAMAYQRYQFEYSPVNVSSGTLFYRLIIDDKIAFTGKLIHK